MPKIFCNVSSCGHFKDNYCCLSNVHVTGNSADKPRETSCESFVRESKATDANHPQMYAKIDCEAASCVFNDHRHCSASSIDVAGDKAENSRETECHSFHC